MGSRTFNVGNSGTEADSKNNVNSSESQEQELDLYIGIFFDGTNNNKIQVALGKRYRRDEILKVIIRKLNKGEYSREQEEFLLKKNIIGSRNIMVKRIIQQPGAMPTVAYLPVDDVTYKSFLNPRTYKSTKELIAEKYYVEYSIIKNGNVLMSVDREEWENENIKGILTQSQLDQLYYGHESGNDKYFIEQRISKQLDSVNHSDRKDEGSHNIGWDRSEKTEHFSFASSLKEDNEKIKKELDSYIDEDASLNGDCQTNYSSSSQSSTYTNVAILESLYDASLAYNEDNGNVTRKYYSIYVEGSGADMKFYPPILGHLHLLGPGVFGLGKGTGDSGAVGKVMKVSKQVDCIIKGLGDQSPKKVFFDIFGFSRGATEARMFNYLLNPKKDDAIYDRLKRKNKNKINDYELFTGNPDEYLKERNIKEKRTRFLGIYDTVSSIGIIREGQLTSCFKRALVNSIGLVGEKLDLLNKGREFLAEIADQTSALFVRFLYEKTINHPEQMANVILTGISPDFFVMNYNLGTEDILNIILEKFPIDKYLELSDAQTVIEKLRDGVESIRVNYVEKYEQHVREKRLDCMEEPHVSIFGKSKYHDQNVADYGLDTTDQADEVFHICALDEVRSNFALVDIQNSIFNNGLELFLPGCHTDIGGGAGLGRDDQKIANISAYTGVPNFICKTKAFDKKNMEFIPVSSEGLMLAGWIDTFDSKVEGGYFRNVPTNKELETEGSVYSDNTVSWIHTPNIIMNRYVKPGYSNIGLNLMQLRANGNEKKMRIMFNDIPKPYKVPEELVKGYYNVIQSKIKNLSNGRFFVNPTSGKYRELRHEWIHFSANEQFPHINSLADNILVNPPNYVGAYLNDRNNIRVEDCIILKGMDINTNKQEYPIKKIGDNLIRLLKDNHSILFPFPLNPCTPFKLFVSADAMLASRIIYKGKILDEDKARPSYMFDYLAEGDLIDVSLKGNRDNHDLKRLIVELTERKERAKHFVEMCQDMQESLGKLRDEEMFYIKTNVAKLVLDQINIKTKNTRIKKTVGKLIFITDFGDGKDFSRKIIKMNINGSLSIGDISEKFLDYYIEELRKRNSYGVEASNAFIDGYTEIRDTLTALVPEKLYKKHWACMVLVNAPELGKLFGHTAGLIQDYNRITDWKKQEEFGHMKIRVLDRQIEMIMSDMNL